MKTLYSILFICLILSLCPSLSLSAQEPKVKVACIGNSITYGHGIATRFQHAYPGILQQFLGKGYDVRNFGMNGRTLLMQGDLPYMRTDLYRQVKAFQPDIITIKLGTNDSKPHNWVHRKAFRHDLETMLDELSSLPGSPEILICSPIPCTKTDSGCINDSIILHGVIPVLKKVARSKHHAFIDLYHPLKPYPQYLPDRIHPDRKGAELIAREIYSAMTGKEAPDFNPDQPFPGTKSVWKGYERYDFSCLGLDAVVVLPEKAAPGRPWIWRPAFFGAFPTVDLALLEKGFHVAYLDLTHLYGSPRAVSLGNRFYRIMTEEFRLSRKVTLEGLSRGGYFAFNWAASNPGKVACMYLDAPVCDITSWPGKERPEFWKGFLREWQVDDAGSGSGFRGNALHLLPVLAGARIPIIAVCGDKDRTVPYGDNLAPFRSAYQHAGGTIELILKPGCDHHPHSLEDPTPIVDFILRYQEGYGEFQHISHRGSLANSFSRFYKEKKGCVAFLGGSITFRKGWKEQVKQSLQQRFPETEFTFIDAGIGSTGSTPHAFRLENDVLEKGIPDLLFFEAAVNDDTNGFDAVQQVRGMEGIARHMLSANPYADMVILHFIADQFIPLYRKGMEPDVVLNHERVANRYSIPSLNLAREVAQRMAAGQFTWKDFGGVHPCREGSRNYSATVNRLFDLETGRLSHREERKPHPMPRPLDIHSYDKGCFAPLTDAQIVKGFHIVKDWMPQPGRKVQLRPGFHHVPMLEADRAGASFTLQFDGRAAGIFCVAGPEAGILEYRIDGGPIRELDMYTRVSSYIYLPCAYMFDTELKTGRHLLEVRLKKGHGEECQIRNFLINK